MPALLALATALDDDDDGDLSTIDLSGHLFCDRCTFYGYLSRGHVHHFRFLSLQFGNSKSNLQFEIVIQKRSIKGLGIDSIKLRYL